MLAQLLLFSSALFKHVSPCGDNGIGKKLYLCL